MKLNHFFSNTLINLKIQKLENFDPLSENIDHPTLKVIVKYRKHPSAIAIASEFTKGCFSFYTITIEYALNKLVCSMLDSSKDIQATNIPIKIKKGA